MYLPSRESLSYLTLSLSLIWFVLQLAVAPTLESATPVFPTTAHNSQLPRDVDGDGSVRDNDTALLLESLRTLEGSLPIRIAEVCTPHPYLDVDGDGFLSEQDAKVMLQDTVERVPAFGPALGPQSPSSKQTSPALARR